MKIKEEKPKPIRWVSGIDTLINDKFLPATALEFIKESIRPYRLKLLTFFGLSFLGIVFWAAAPFTVRSLINELSSAGRVTETAKKFVFLFILFKLADELFWRFAENSIRKSKPILVEASRTRLFAYVLQKPFGYYVNSSSGQLGHWINKTADTFNELIDHTIWGTWPQTFGLLLSAAFLLFASWELGVLFILWMLILLFFNNKRGKKFGKLVELESAEKSKSSAIVADSLSNNLSVRVFNSKRHEVAYLRNQQDLVVEKWTVSWKYHHITNAVKGQSVVWMSAISMLLIIDLFSKGKITVGDVALFLAYFGAASSTIWELSWMMDQYYRTFGTIQNALDGLSKGDSERTVSKKVQLPEETDIELKNVSFNYPESKSEKVLDGIDLKIKMGEKIGIVGHSGAGKTTLVGLLLGFYEIEDGEFCIGKTNVRDLGPDHLRELIAYVPQDTNLFNRSVLENIRYARPNATLEEVRNSARDAQALEFIEKLSNGFDTLIGERGVKLSGGQRQRIAVARALLKNSPILLLDEATSALDSVSEQAIQKAFSLAMKGRSAIVIAHRLSTLKNLDRIIVLDSGKIKEQGTHDELVAMGGVYADLWTRQKDGFIAD